MFVFSIRASTVRFFAVLCTLVVLVGIVVGVGFNASVATLGNTTRFSGIKDNEQRVAFIESFGLTVDPDVYEEMSFSLPDNFDAIIAGYNEIQKAQGLDLARYKNKTVTRYTYKVNGVGDFSGVSLDGGEVYVNLIIYRAKVIACDVSSADPSGFVLPLAPITVS